MPRQHLYNGFWLCPPYSPESNASIKTATRKQTPIGTPGQRVYRSTLAGEGLEVCAPVGVPELNSGVIPTASDQVSIGRKGEGLDVIGPPVRPEQLTTFYVPQLESTIPASSCQRTSIRAESESRDRVEMRLPGQVQQLPSLLPYPHFSPPAARHPVLPVAADGHSPGC